MLVTGGAGSWAHTSSTRCAPPARTSACSTSGPEPTSATPMRCSARSTVSTTSAIRPGWSGWGWTSSTWRPTSSHNDLAPRCSCGRSRAGASAGGSCWRRAWSSTAKAATRARRMGRSARSPSRRRPRRRPLRATLPALRRGARAGGGRRGRADRPAERVRGDEAPPGAPRVRLRAGDRGAGRRAALPQRVRAADAARHPVRRRRGDLRRRARRGARARVFEDGGQRRDFVHVATSRAANLAALLAPSRRQAPTTPDRGATHRRRDGHRAARGARRPAPPVGSRASSGSATSATSSHRPPAATELGFIAQEDFATAMAELADEHRVTPRVNGARQRVTGRLGS